MKLFVVLIFAVFASEKNVKGTENDSKCGERIASNEEVVVKIEDEYAKVNNRFTSKFIGVSYYERDSKWKVQRWSKHENKQFSNGCYDDEEAAAHASDTLARKLMENGEQKLKLNFPDDQTEVYPEKDTYSKFIGVSYYKRDSKWFVQRWSKNKNNKFSNGCYDNEETAAHASDTLARKLMENGAQKLKLNFPDELTEVYPSEKDITSKFIGVSYHKNTSKWCVQRKSENKNYYNGYYDDEETAAHASDTLARKLIKNGKQKLKLNFPDELTEVYREEEKGSKFIGVSFHKKTSKWYVQRWSKNENKQVFNGYYGDEETAAHASDTLARKLMENSEQKLKLNFPDDYTEVYPAENQTKRKRQNEISIEHPQNN